MRQDVDASRIASFLERPLYGDDIPVTKPGSLKSLTPATFTFATSLTADMARTVNASSAVLIIADEGLAGVLRVPHILHPEPKLAFVIACAEFFPLLESESSQHSRLSASAEIGERVQFGHNVILGPHARIGAGTRIGHNVVIGRGVSIGRDCFLKSGSIIGERGFGFVRDEHGAAHIFPHYASVTIGNAVEIGALSTVVSGALDDTLVEDEAKINDHVHVAHNVRIGRRTMVAAGAILSGSSDIGQDVWVGINASIRDGVSLGDRVVVGMAAVVTKSFPPDVTIVGCPAAVVPT